MSEQPLSSEEDPFLPTPRPHRRQYLLAPEPIAVADDWVWHTLDGIGWLGHCPALRIDRGLDAKGRPWWLLGLAVQALAERPDPLDDLAMTPTESVPGRTESWCGRWTLIGPTPTPTIQVDASAQMGCHWTLDPDGAVWASSSPALIARAPGVGALDPDLALAYERGLSWVVPPEGARAGAHRLLASQLLDVRTGAVLRRQPIPSSTVAVGDASDPMTALASCLTEAVRRLPDLPLHVALSAGADSRVVLAATLAAGRSCTSFTRLAARMSAADRLIPPRLCRAVGVDHRYLRPRRADPVRAMVASIHTDGQVTEGDALPFVEAARRDLVGIELGGQGFGVGKLTNRDLAARLDVPDGPTVDEIAAALGEINPATRRALASWFAWIEPDGPRVDWRDRFYLEQRMGGWQAAKEQLYDLDRHERFFPLNSAIAYGYLLAINEQQRRGGAHQRKLLDLLAPALLAEPVNPDPGDVGLPSRVLHRLIVDPRGSAGRALAYLTPSRG